MRITRVLLIGLATIVLLALIGSLILWAVLSSWVPTKGKALLIQTLEQHAPISVSIDSMRYDLARGLTLTEVRVSERASQELWGHASVMRVQVDWLRLLITRTLAFRARAPLERPLRTLLTVSGSYHLRRQTLTLTLDTAEIPINSITAPLKQHLPRALTDGTLRLHVRVARASPAPPLIAGRIEGTDVVWTTPSQRLSGDVILEGSATPPPPGGRWEGQAQATLHRATLQGLPTGPITQLGASARITSERIEIERLTGVMLGSPWTAEGTIELTPQPGIEALLSAPVALAPLAAWLPVANGAWQPTGIADLRMVCRGPLQPRVFLDCLSRAELQQVTVAGSKLTYPLTDVTGRVDYDLLTRRGLITDLTGRLKQEPFRINGEVALGLPMWLSLQLAGTVPLDAIPPWLPATHPFRQLGGSVVLDLDVSGPSTALQYEGEVELRDAAAALTTPSMRMDHVDAVVRLTPSRIAVSQATMRLNDEPLTASAILERQDPPRLVAMIESSRARLSLTSRVTPQEILLDAGRLQLAASDVSASGVIGRTAERPSQLTVSGVVELADLTRLPFVPLPALDAWHLQGLCQMDTTLRGRLTDWTQATVQSRLRADRISVRDIPVDALSLTMDQHDRVLRVDVPSARVAEGKLWGDLTLDRRQPSTAFLLQADLVGLQLEQLAHSLPAWRARTINGSASAHVVFSGTWEQRMSWRGDGWLNASGERLGDVPLLDKLFRGMFGVLGDRFGLEPLRRAQVTQASMRWRLADERFSTEDLRLAGLAGTDPVAVYASGSVGLDQTLDLVIEPELSEGLLQSPTLSPLAGTVLKAVGQFERARRLVGRHRLVGTLKEPKYFFEFSAEEIIRQLAPSGLLQGLFESVR